jgi:hypothetical protein
LFFFIQELYEIKIIKRWNVEGVIKKGENIIAGLAFRSES